MPKLVSQTDPVRQETGHVALPRVLLVDDHTDFRAACALLLAREFAVVRELDHALELTPAVRELAPDIILLDISMPEINGLDAAERLLKEVPETKVIFLTGLFSPADVERAFRLGGRGYILKQSLAQLSRALRQVLSGKRYLSPGLGPLPDSDS